METPLETYKSLRIERSERTNGNGVTTYTLRVWSGRQRAPYAHYWFRTSQRRDVREQRVRADARERHKAERAASRKAAVNPFQVGDVLSYSWGWEQTNVDFLKVVARTERTVTLAHVAQQMEATGHMQGKAIPVPDQILDKPMLKHRRVTPEGTVSLRHGCACKWDGKPEYVSWYA